MSSRARFLPFLLFLSLLLLPLTGSTAPVLPAVSGPIFGAAAGPPRPPAPPIQLSLQLPSPAAVSPLSLPPVSTLPRVLPRVPSSGAKAWVDQRAQSGLFTGSANVTLTAIDPPNVPEPSTAALLALGLLGLAVRRR